MRGLVLECQATTAVEDLQTVVQGPVVHWRDWQVWQGVEFGAVCSPEEAVTAIVAGEAATSEIAREEAEYGVRTHANQAEAEQTTVDQGLW